MWSDTNEHWVEGATPHLRMGPPLNGRSSHLIEAAKQGRLDQMFFFLGAADVDTGTADDCPTTVRRPSDNRKRDAGPECVARPGHQST